MPTLKIDGKEVWVEPGTNVLEAAKKLGIEIPHYCYHPALKVAGSCRMCLVEIEGMPKLQISCHTKAADGMVVWTNTEKVRKARQAVLEFLLVDHPLDCPVCDQAGECYLQIYYMEHGLYKSRLRENKIKKEKAKPIGKHIILDQERCILCSRCVRFTREVTKTFELGIFNRGNRSVVDLYPGIPELQNRYQGNLADICPVGALTDRDFRFQTRVWYLQQAKSICPGCSRGCNIEIDYNISREYKAGGRRIPRIRPRHNPKVNGYWMCDDGRYGYKYVDALDRILLPRRLEDGEPVELSWPAAYQMAAKLLSEATSDGADKVGVLLSAKMTNEELFAARKLFSSLGVSRVGFSVEPKEPGYEDDLLIKADKNPNTKGAELLQLGLGTGKSDASALLDAAEKGEVDTVVIFNEDLSKSAEAERAEKVLPGLGRVIYVGTNWNATAAKADLVLPMATFVEQEGTFTNFEGRVQRFWKAVEPLGESRPGLSILSGLARALGLEPTSESAEEVFAELAEQVPAFSGLSYQELGDHGKLVASQVGQEEAVEQG
ncbi:MAG TPA: 2Fe-2S iron-sulfur cluster binding domain-containing protein [Bacteroidetes bacterium]|nr:2Fe-2S iron-sulfur cluster binding domain-containing protein [Bacteroidota bacterium]